MRLTERGVRAALDTWRRLSLDARVVGALALLNWALLIQNHTVVMVTRDAPLWQLFPGLSGPLYLFVVGLVGLAYPLRDLRSGPRFTPRARWAHFATLVLLFVVIPTIAAVLLRATGRPYTYIHDGALIAEEAARKLLAGKNPYSVDYLDTPLFYWPMINNPALYHFTYFPLLFLVTVPPLLLFEPHLGWYDERVLFLPAFLACLVIGTLLVRDTPRRIALAAALALNPQLFPFVVEGRTDAFVLLFVLLAAFLLRTERRVLAGLALAVAVGTKLHAAVFVPFVAAYLLARARPRSLRDAWRAVAPAALPFTVVTAATFVPFLVWDWRGFYDDIVLYNVGASAWSYPISGIGFSMLLHAAGIIPYRSAEFPFWGFQLLAALPVSIITLRRLWREPTTTALLVGYATTLLAFLFFGRYFQTSYLGYIAAVATPALFLGEREPRRVAVLTPAASHATSAAMGK